MAAAGPDAVIAGSVSGSDWNATCMVPPCTGAELVLVEPELALVLELPDEPHAASARATTAAGAAHRRHLEIGRTGPPCWFVDCRL